MRQIILWIFILTLNFLTVQGKTKLRCFEIKGKVLDKMNIPISNQMLIFHRGKWNADTVYTDSSGNYKHTEAYWPPCNRKNRRKFWRTSISVTVCYGETQVTFEYIPKAWLQVCEGDKTLKPKVMNKDIIFI